MDIQMLSPWGAKDCRVQPVGPCAHFSAFSKFPQSACQQMTIAHKAALIRCPRLFSLQHKGFVKGMCSAFCLARIVDSSPRETLLREEAKNPGMVEHYAMVFLRIESWYRYLPDVFVFFLLEQPFLQDICTFMVFLEKQWLSQKKLNICM